MRTIRFSAINALLNSPYFTALALSFICILLHFTGAEPLLTFQRIAIDNGEYWRLISGNLLHTNHWHLAMNLAGFWVILMLHRPHYNSRGLAFLLLLLCLLEGIGLWLFYPQLYNYVGLSGLLHGLFTIGAYRDIKCGLRSGYLLLLGVIAKVGYEQIFGASDEVTHLIGARVATEAHLIGVIAGIICIALMSSSNRFARLKG